MALECCRINPSGPPPTLFLYRVNWIFWRCWFCRAADGAPAFLYIHQVPCCREERLTVKGRRDQALWPDSSGEKSLWQAGLTLTRNLHLNSAGFQLMPHRHCIIQDCFRIYLNRISCLQVELNGSRAMCGERNGVLNSSLTVQVGVPNLSSDRLSASSQISYSLWASLIMSAIVSPYLM